MNIKINNDTVEIKTNLNVAFKLQDQFKLPYMKVIEHITTKDAGIDEQVKFLYIGYQSGGGTLTEEEFCKRLLESNGINQINDYLEKMILELQYPGMSEEEIEEELKKKIAKIKRMSSIGAQ